MKTLSEIFSDAGVFQYGTVDTASIFISAANVPTRRPPAVFRTVPTAP